MANRKTTYCAVCYKPYKDKAHLWRCLPDADEAAINLIHKNEKDAIASFASGRLVAHTTLAGWMKDAGLPLNLLENVATVLTSAGHVVRGEPPAAAASLSAAPMPSGGGVPAAAASAAAAGTSQSVSVSDDSDRVLRPKATERDCRYRFR